MASSILCGSIKSMYGANLPLTTRQQQEIRDYPEVLDRYEAQINSHADVRGFAHAGLLFDVIRDYKRRCETAAEMIQQLLDSPKTDWSVRDLEDAHSWLSGPCACDDCAAKVGSLVGCPDGAEICRDCFDNGAH